MDSTAMDCDVAYEPLTTKDQSKKQLYKPIFILTRKIELPVNIYFLMLKIFSFRNLPWL